MITSQLSRETDSESWLTYQKTNLSSLPVYVVDFEGTGIIIHYG